jgi:hypothetical protein
MEQPVDHDLSGPAETGRVYFEIRAIGDVHSRAPPIREKVLDLVRPSTGVVDVHDAAVGFRPNVADVSEHELQMMVRRALLEAESELLRPDGRRPDARQEKDEPCERTEEGADAEPPPSDARTVLLVDAPERGHSEHDDDGADNPTLTGRIAQHNQPPLETVENSVYTLP